MLKNTYAKLCDIVYNLEVVDMIYLNGKELSSDQIHMIATNKELFQDLTHIDDVKRYYSTDEQYGWSEYYVSNNWIPRPTPKPEDDWCEYTEVYPYTDITDSDLL